VFTRSFNLIDMKNVLLTLIFAQILISGCTRQLQNGAPQTGYSSTGKNLTVFTTAANTNYRLTETKHGLGLTDFGQPLETQPCVFVDPTRSFQTFIGIGGALTDAAAETLAKLPKDKQQEVMRAYYDTQKGIGYTLARTNIHSCDFSSDSYTYVKDGDKDLSTFSIDHDRKYKIPLIKKAMEAAGGKLTLFASPWSPPAWMKDNKEMLHGGKLMPEYYQTWANYFVRFIRAYEKEGIPIWGVTIQNEPMAKQTWESCLWTAEEERDFLKKNLGPTFEKEGLKDKKIIFWDHNRDLMYQRASTMLNDPEAAKYAWGIGYHWYETWTGGEQQYDNLRRVRETYPDKNLIFTEGCNGPFNAGKLNDWGWGEIYGHNMINDFNAGTVAWTDWNILLDETGGPNHVQNFCYAPIIADTRTGKVEYMNEYYYLGHFSKFIRPGAKRVASTTSRSQLLTTAFLNTDGSLAVVVMNESDKDIPYHLWIAGKAIELSGKAHSIETLVLK
jgi:glucosylceramidase